MAELTASQPPHEYENVLTHILAEINMINQQMKQDRAEIDRLKADSARLEAETQSILARLKVMV
jgi:peptidoglycan hydrolase CwlO-like protein